MVSLRREPRPFTFLRVHHLAVLEHVVALAMLVLVARDDDGLTLLSCQRRFKPLLTLVKDCAI